MTTPRRTQEERSTATRGRLLDATIECLVDYGYAGTTVTRVAQRAAVTRGAQVHHFGTKEALVLDAVRHLNDLRARDTIDRLATLEPGDGWVDALLELLWAQHQGPLFVATIEMEIAGRTNAQLSVHLGEVEEAVTTSMAKVSDDPQIREAVFTSMDAIRGLITSSWHVPTKELDARWKRLKRNLRMMYPAP